MAKKAIIIGAGPAGLTAAYELLKRTGIQPIILEKSGDIGGISKTINYKGNRMDIGGHRFFSKSDRVMNWWMNIMPLQQTEEETVTIQYQNKSRTVNGSANGTSATTVADENATATATAPAEKVGKVMLLRKRLSRIYFLRKFFTYPIQLSIDTLRKLGVVRTIHILLSYIYAQLVPRKPEKSLEDFLINRFGRQLYLLFFKDYTEKVWGVPCHEISAEWGAQRIKGVSISKAIKHAVQMMVKKKQKSNGDIAQKDTETSLIEQFLYPALGPGQLWEEVARQVVEMGGEIIHHQHVKEIVAEDGRVCSITAVNRLTGEVSVYEGDYFFSTMPIKELIAGMNGEVPADVKAIAAGLQYRDFITVGVLLERLCATNPKTGEAKELDLQDTWIYIQEKDVKVGRLQLFNNWSPYMVNKPGNVWIGMEYFCNEGDEFWNLSDEEIKRTAIAELEKMGLAQVDDVLDSTVHRVEKTYPAYFGTYDRFDRIREFVDGYENLFLVGRNGMHKYNNADHSMLTAMTAVDNICEGVMSKDNIWAINTEQEYHEEKKTGAKRDDDKDNVSGNMRQEQVDERASKKREEKIVTPELEPVLSFRDFVIGNKRNRAFLWFAAFAILIQFAVFKYLYPFAGFIDGDSYVYLETAYYNLPINTYPIGYSNFIRLFSVFSRSDTALVGFQYLLLQTTALGFIFTIFYFFQPSRFVQIVLFLFVIVNPIFLYLSNYVSSDALFISLSLLWFTTLLWIVHGSSQKLIFLHILILFYAFTIRYNALYYPFLTVPVILLSRHKLLVKLAGAACCWLLVLGFILNTSYKYKELTGIKQFTPFSGWQLANNALYTYRYIDSSKRRPVPKEFKAIDKAVTHYFDTTRNIFQHPQEIVKANSWYMWDPKSPLQIFMEQQFRKQMNAGPTLKWAKMGPLYAKYGSFLIKTYPMEYARHYLWPNLGKYYAPPVEFLDSYNMGKDSINSIAVYWFGFKNNKVKTAFKDLKVNVLNFYPYLTGTINMVFLFSLLFFATLNGFKTHRRLSKSLKVISCFWFTNFCFSVLASPVALRFQVFPIMVFFAATAIFLEYIVKVAFSNYSITAQSTVNDFIPEGKSPHLI